MTPWIVAHQAPLFKKLKLWEIVKDREAWHAAGHGVIKSWTHLNDWTTAATTLSYCLKQCRSLPSRSNSVSYAAVDTLISYATGRTVPGGSDGKESAWSVGDLGLIPGLGRSLREGNGNPLQYSCLENPMDGGAWWTTTHGVTKSQIWLNNFTFTLCNWPVYWEVIWKRPSPYDTVQRGTAQRDGLIIHLVSQPEFRISEMAWRWLESLDLGKAYLASWRKKQQPAPVFLLGESQGQRGLVGYRSWDNKESDTMLATMGWVTKHNV